METTAEARWFYEGAVPPGVAAWFGSLPAPAEDEDARVDRYLRPTDAALAVKLREGQVEVKRRALPGEPFAFAPVARGLLEHWHKWTLPLSGDGLPDAPPPHWVAVRKQRSVQRYRVDAVRGAVPCEAGEEPPSLCQVELARLEVEGAPWWSLCLEASGEASGEAGGLRGRVAETALRLFAVGHPPALHPEHAVGYPAWLLRLGAAR